MPLTSNVGPAKSSDEHLTPADCEAMLQRVCFGHLSFVRGGNADVLPIRYAFLDGWVYFRADLELRELIARSPWLVLSVIEPRDSMRLASVVVRGGCYEAEQTGSAIRDAAALEGIIELRDRATVGPEGEPRIQRTSTVFRLHIDEMRGITAVVPCPPGERPYDALELRHLRETGRDHTAGEDARADDDGMAEPNPPSPGRPDRSSRIR